MKLNQYSSNQVSILQLDGRIDTHSVSWLRTQLNETVSRHSANIVVDLAGVNFIDSSGLAALVQGMRSCRSGGGNLCLSGPQRPVRLILELTRLDSAIDIFPDEHAAIASFQSVD